MNQAAIKFRGGTTVPAVQMVVWRMRMKKKPKYAYVTVIQLKYGDSPWEDVSEYRTAEEKKNVRRDFKEYLISGGGSYRIIDRRVPNE